MRLTRPSLLECVRLARVASSLTVATYKTICSTMMRRWSRSQWSRLHWSGLGRGATEQGGQQQSDLGETVPTRLVFRGFEDHYYNNKLQVVPAATRTPWWRLVHRHRFEHVTSHLQNILIFACIIDKIAREILYEDLFCSGEKLANLFCDVVGRHSSTVLSARGSGSGDTARQAVYSPATYTKFKVVSRSTFAA
jgi:hypothetical protein